jgi:voltage-gated potassium channel
LRYRVALALTDHERGAGLALRTAIVATVMVSAVMAFGLSINEVHGEFASGEHWAVPFCSLVFALEYVLRLWAAPEVDETGHIDVEASHRTHYAFSFMGLVDLLCWLPLVPGWLFEPGDWLSALQMLPLFKLARYIPGLELVGTVLRNESRLLLATLSSLLVLVPLMSALVFAAEHAVQPEVFRSIPHAMWWGIVTMTTSGYGDMVPVTAIGRTLAGFSMLIGIAMLAMPVGIVANGVANEVRRRELLCNYQMVSRLPMFRGLHASAIADIAGLLRPQVMPGRSVVLTRGEMASSLYFIVDGEVEVQLDSGPVVLRVGDVFGEGGLIEDRPRKATVRTLRTCRFLVLDLTDFHTLTQRQPDILRAIRAVAEARA